MFQNLGDGTFFHSGSLAIRQAVAAGTNITYKILYNSAVAMTGGQDAAGAMPVPELTRILEAEGVKRSSCDRRARQVSARRRCGPRASRSGTATGSTRRSASCATIPGVTALVYDQRCAAEKRRLRKRGKLPDPAHARRHQRGGVRGLRRLRREVQLPLRAPGRDRVRAQDADPPVVVQQGLLLPARRLPVVPDRRARSASRQKKERKRLHGRARAARARAARCRATPTSS